MNSDFRAGSCNCRKRQETLGSKYVKASPDCGKGEIRIARMAVGRLFIQILVSLEALLATEQHEGNEFRWQNLNSLPESHFTDRVNALKPEGGFEP